MDPPGPAGPGGGAGRSRHRARRAALVGDERVLSLHGARAKASLEAAGLETAVCSFPGGEQGKTLETYGAVMNFLAERRLERTDVLVALGGGVTGDLGGFAAATYQRGMRLAQIPTTLLAAVDSSVGGKTGVDLASGKNLCGCFYQPDLVLCDPEVLTTLPPEVFRDGCAEVIKYGILCSEEFFHSIETTPVEAQLETVIARCVAMKRDIVAEDEFDLGRRQLLNLGHTLGHAVEARSRYSVSHGCAVAIGMAVIARGAAAMAFAGRIRRRRWCAFCAGTAFPRNRPIPARSCTRRPCPTKRSGAASCIWSSRRPLDDAGS